LIKGTHLKIQSNMGLSNQIMARMMDITHGKKSNYGNTISNFDKCAQLLIFRSNKSKHSFWSKRFKDKKNLIK
jgi:hypothetical protein